MSEQNIALTYGPRSIRGAVHATYTGARSIYAVISRTDGTSAITRKNKDGEEQDFQVVATHAVEAWIEEDSKVEEELVAN